MDLLLMRVFIGGVIGGLILYFAPGLHSPVGCLVAGMAMTWLLLILGPRSFVERIAVVEIAAVLGWTAGPSAYPDVGLLWYLFGWFAAGSALSYYLRPKSE